jgi:hypothetical protein
MQVKPSPLPLRCHILTRLRGARLLTAATWLASPCGHQASKQNSVRTRPSDGGRPAPAPVSGDLKGVTNADEHVFGEMSTDEFFFME